MKYLKKILRPILNFLYKIDGYLKVKKAGKARHKDIIINVLFVCQYLPSWEKNKALFDKMLFDHSFNPKILCIPSNPNKKINDTYESLSRQGIVNLINPLCENGTYLSLSKIKYDYIFYDRPYNTYLPTEYKAKNSAKFGKVCLHPYALGLSKTLNYALTFSDFFSYVSIYFADSIDTRDFFKNEISKNNRYKKSVYLGYLGLANIISQQNNSTNIWDFSRGKTRIIWTPRWSTDSVGGGSNFFKYMDDFLTFNNSKNTSVLIRPHPKMFDNFVNSGLMTRSDVLRFKDSINQSCNLALDETSNYVPTLWKSDLLISDFSTIIMEYILTGKPVIYCKSNIDWDFFDFAKELISCCYIADSFKDICKYITDLSNGIDPLKTKREEFISNYANKEWLSMTDVRFLEYFKKDFFGNLS